MLGVIRLLLTFAGGRVFVEGLCWIYMALYSSLILFMFEKEIRVCFVVVGGVWNGFLLGRIRHQVLPCRFCGAPDGDGHFYLGMYLSSSC